MNTCSLLIPCYNAAKYLPRLWQTVEAQTVPFDEIICYDDGSTDNTADVARELGAKVIQGEKCRGAAYARNQLAQATNCSWFHFHDADDLLKPNYLERTKSRINQDVDVILCNVDWIDENTRELVISWHYVHQELNKDPINYIISHPIGGINGLYRRDIFLAVNGFDESMRVWEDADLHVRLAAAGAKFVVVEEVLSISLRHDDTVSNNRLINWNYRFQALKKYSQQLNSSSISTIAKQAEMAARSLINSGNRTSAQEAIKFCQSLGGNPPSTNNPILIILKLVLPAFWVLQLQQYIRRPRNLSTKYGQDFSRS
ncbi:MAG: glycosyltransferase family A protein [Xenococcaceae cyanobacterium MO_207.B15]|nr:glycosyltransferase family A protein [Xenococcaceae cyanobacterium MO_207.B15]